MIAGYIRTPLGGFINHSEEPNCYLVLSQDWDDYRVYNLMTLCEIQEGDEITLNYDM
jgi:SET domain-containing protein